MSFVEGLTLKYKQITEQCYRESFIQEMGDGILSEEKFRNYVVQDSILFRSFVKSYGYGLVKSQTLREMKRFFTMIKQVEDSENLTRLDYLRQFDLTDDDIDMTPRKIECQQYCDFLETNAAKGSPTDVVMAGLPTMIVRGYIFGELKKNRPDVLEGRFASLVNEYTSQSFDDFTCIWIAYANSITENQEEERMKNLEDIFKQGIFNELYFWQMVGKDKE